MDHYRAHPCPAPGGTGGFVERPCGAKIYYETHGVSTGPPVLVIAGGGMESSVPQWFRPDWEFNAIAELSRRG